MSRFAELCFDPGRWLIFGWTSIDAVAQFAVAHAIEKIDEQAESEPYEKPAPGNHRQTAHQDNAKNDTDNWKPRYPRDAEWTVPLRRGPSQHDDADAHQYESEQGSDVGQICEFPDVRDHSHATDENAGPDRRDVRSPEPWMNSSEVLGE